MCGIVVECCFKIVSQKQSYNLVCGHWLHFIAFKHLRKYHIGIFLDMIDYYWIKIIFSGYQDLGKFSCHWLIIAIICSYKFRFWLIWMCETIRIFTVPT